MAGSCQETSKDAEDDEISMFGTFSGSKKKALQTHNYCLYRFIPLPQEVKHNDHIIYHTIPFYIISYHIISYENLFVVYNKFVSIIDTDPLCCVTMLTITHAKRGRLVGTPVR